MDNRFRLVAVALLAFGAGVSHAGYAQLAPPERFSGSAGNWKYAPAANDLKFGKVAFQPGALRVPVPGSPVVMPASYRFAANAGRFAAAAVFMNPYVRTGVAIASWLGLASLVWDAVNRQWVVNEESVVPGGDEFRIMNMEPDRAWSSSKSVACQAEVNFQNGRGIGYTYSVASSDPKCGMRIVRDDDGYVFPISTFSYELRSTPCPPGTRTTPAGCVAGQTRVVTQPEFEDLLAPKIMPDNVPWELPFPTPLPVEQPVVNPEPGPNPQPRPMFVPTGDPLPNPNYDPSADPSPDNQPWYQPGVRITPRPTVDDPWRVDLEPINRPQPGPDPVADPDPDPSPDDKPKPQDQKSLCEQHPDVVACQKLGDVSAVPIPNENRALTITPDSGYGPSNGACPAPRTATIMGVQLSMPFDLICEFASTIRPIVLAFAWLSAALTFFGLGRKEA